MASVALSRDAEASLVPMLEHVPTSTNESVRPSADKVGLPPWQPWMLLPISRS